MKRNFNICFNGSIVTIQPKTKKASKWIDDNLQLESWQIFGPAIAIDSRFAEDIINAIENEF
jgi:hypothetical protein